MLMKFGCWTVAAVMAVTAASASAQMAGMKMDDKSMASDAAGKSFDDLLSLIEGEVVASAEAMPADKFDFAPSQAIFVPSQKVDFSNPKPVMTFAQEVKHLTMANYGFFATKDNKPTVDRKTISNLKTKDEIIAALKASYAFAHKSVSTMTTANGFVEFESDGRKTTMAATFAFGLAHMNDHYGQLNEYLRMNGIVPPASRK
jgi:uncharacterized damage-inducible protein DinB